MYCILYTNKCVVTGASNHIAKFTQDTAVVALTTGGSEFAYREELATLEKCLEKHRPLNVEKTKEILVDHRKKE